MSTDVTGNNYGIHLAYTFSNYANCEENLRQVDFRKGSHESPEIGKLRWVAGYSTAQYIAAKSSRLV